MPVAQPLNISATQTRTPLEPSKTEGSGSLIHPVPLKEALEVPVPFRVHLVKTSSPNTASRANLHDKDPALHKLCRFG